MQKKSEKLKDGIKISVDQVVLELLIKTSKIFVLINNSRNTCASKILIPVVSFTDNLF